jgi:hypothetical protein
MNNHQFNYFSDRSLDGFFTINDTAHIEFVNGRLYSKSKVVWTTCNNYFLVVKEANYENGLRPGDTLYVKLLSLHKDTLTYLASAYGQSYQLKVIKSN